MFTQYSTSIAIKGNFRGLTYRSRLMGLLVVCLGGLLGLGAASQAKAETKTTGCDNTPTQITLTMSPIVGARDAPIPSRIGSWGTTPVPMVWSCTAVSQTPALLALGVEFHPNLPMTGSTFYDPEWGKNYTVYDTGYTGLGIIFNIKTRFANISSCTDWSDLGNLIPLMHSACYVNKATLIISSIEIDVRAAFVKTGDIPSGPMPSLTTVMTAVPAAGAVTSTNQFPSSVSDRDAVYVIAGGTIPAGTCTISNVDVPLGNNHLWTEMPSVGSTTKAVDFKIALTKCPAGMKGIDYRIDSNTDPVSGYSASEAIVELDARSTARGVGVQLLDTKGDPFTRLNSGTFTTLTSYSPALGGDFDIPLKARYYRTGTNLSGGTANTSMNFTISYY